MSKRLEVGCRAMIVAVSVENSPLIDQEASARQQKRLVGKTGILTRGPYPSITGRPSCWTVEGPDLASVMESGRPVCRDVPSSVLVRIDDPDVKLDEVENLVLEHHS